MLFLNPLGSRAPNGLVVLPALLPLSAQIARGEDLPRALCSTFMTHFVAMMMFPYTAGKFLLAVKQTTPPDVPQGTTVLAISLHLQAILLYHFLYLFLQFLRPHLLYRIHHLILGVSLPSHTHF